MNINNYYPIYDEEKGLFKDHVPDNNQFINGVKCNCGCLKKSAYTNKKLFEKHLETPTHKKWLEYFQHWNILNNRKYDNNTENNDDDDTINKQELIITYLEYEITNLKKENNMLKEKLAEKSGFLYWLMP